MSEEFSGNTGVEVPAILDANGIDMEAFSELADDSFNKPPGRENPLHKGGIAAVLHILAERGLQIDAEGDKLPL